jgi:spore maturation protein CgeB
MTARALSIAFFGSSLVSAYWNGAATYYRGLLRALAARGHRIAFFEPDAFERQRHRDMEDPAWARVVVYPPTEAGALAALGEARGADVLVKASGVGVLDAFLEAAVLAERAPQTMAVFWDVDAPATLERMREDPADTLAPLVRAYDLVATYGGGQRAVDGYTALGARACVPIYNALDADTHFPVAADPAFAAELLFVGNRLPDREQRVRHFFHAAAERRPQRTFLLGGSGWVESELPGNVRAIGHVYTHQHNVLNCSALAVLNVNRDSMAAFGYSPPTRLFEAAGAGACVITDAWEGIEMFLEPGAEVLVARDGAEVAALLEGLTPQRARAMGLAARRRMLAEHTYARRAVQVERVLLARASPSASVPA